ncbi:MAG: hypothetical protein IE931_14575 [Sphingobacteriales bacterium]|nr:hypothetical protein [Sphingobacteriales bacterium]
MATKIYTITILLIIVLTMTFSTCRKGGLGCANTVYNFQIAAKIRPNLDSIHIGDTIWIELNTSTNLTDVVSNKIINYSGAKNLGTLIGFGDYSILNNPVPSANNFTTILIKGKEINNPNKLQVREYLFEEQNDRYILKLGIIANKKGIFGIGLSNAQNVYRASDECSKAFFNIILQDTRQHYYLNPNINSSNTDTIKPTGSYYFKVY